MSNHMELVRKAIEGTYNGLCTIWEYENVEDEDTGETTSKLVPVYENVPCKVSKKTISPVSGSEVVNTIKYEPVLFISPGIEIKPGSKIVVTQHGVTRECIRSGEPFVYETHQEIVLQRIDKA